MRAPWLRFVVVLLVLTGCSSDDATSPKEPDQPEPVEDSVSFWNKQANSTIVAIGFQFPGDASVSQAIVHIAIYDAVVAIDGGYQPYVRTTETGQDDASVEAAVATAARATLEALFPDQYDRLNRVYDEYMSDLSTEGDVQRGMEVGRSAAMSILSARAGDGRDYPPEFRDRSSAPGRFRRTEPSTPLGTGLGEVTPFAMESPDQARPGGPPSLTSKAYARDVEEVARLGELRSDGRTREQTQVARFWTDHPVAQFNRALREIVDESDLSTLDAARLFAATSVAGADAMIGCFNTKYHFLFWRPVHAIPRWKPLIPTPNHPDYPSAHACYSTALTRTLAAVLGDEPELIITSRITGTSKAYPDVDTLLEEIDNARVWGGIHFRTATRDGGTIGEFVADRVVENYFLPQ